jgi:hypothetical protein
MHRKKSNKCCIFHKDKINDNKDDEEVEEDGAESKGRKKHHHHHHHEDEDHQIYAVKRPDQELTSIGLGLE